MPAVTDDELRTIFQLHSIAVVGCSATQGKDAHEVPKYLKQHGYEIIPVNPTADVVLGHQAYDSLTEVDVECDIVNVFRPSSEVSGIVDQGLSRTDVGMWLQLGIHDDDALSRAEGAGLQTVHDRCMKQEHSRLFSTPWSAIVRVDREKIRFADSVTRCSFATRVLSIAAPDRASIRTGCVFAYR